MRGPERAGPGSAEAILRWPRVTPMVIAMANVRPMSEVNDSYSAVSVRRLFDHVTSALTIRLNS